MAASLVAAYVLYATRGVRSVLVWLVGAVLLFGLGYYLIQSGAAFLNLEELTIESVEEFYGTTRKDYDWRLARDSTVSVFTPTGAVVGFVTALARPFPWEANNLQSLMISLETVGMVSLLLGAATCIHY